jgi:release factor glutamine methyltransferase
MLGLAIEALCAAGVDDPAREARLILTEGAGLGGAGLSGSLDDDLCEDGQARIKTLLEARLTGRPMAQVLGRRAFFKHEFCVTPDVLDPRPETETLVLAALEAPFACLLDLGTGTGAIALSLLAERPDATALATDISAAALKVARDNAKALKLEGRCRFLRSDWFAGVTGRFDLIVSNPPYISAAEMEDVSPALAFEPRFALTDEADGLSAYRILAAEAGAYLEPGGRIMLEIGWSQAKEVTSLLEAAGFA